MNGQMNNASPIKVVTDIWIYIKKRVIVLWVFAVWCVQFKLEKFCIITILRVTLCLKQCAREKEFCYHTLLVLAILQLLVYIHS